MSKYSEAAILAARLLKEETTSDPHDVWTQVTKKVFPTSVDMQNKGCLKGAFLGLCNDGLVDGVSPGNYSNPAKNGKYIIEIINIPRKNRFLSSQPNLLWKKLQVTRNQKIIR